MAIQKNDYVPSGAADTIEVETTGTLDPISGIEPFSGMYRFHNTPAANLVTSAGSVANATIYVDIRPSASAAPTAAELLAGLATIALAPGDTLDIYVEGCKVYAAGPVASLIITFQPLTQVTTVYD